VLSLGAFGQFLRRAKQTMTELETKVELLKKELHDQKKIHNRLDVAIEKLTDVSNSIHRMLAVHEEKITRQEEAIFDAEQKIEVRRNEVLEKIDDIYSRINTIQDRIMAAAKAQHESQNREIERVRDDISKRVGILEKWRHVIIGGSIVVGFLLHRYFTFGG
jgi:chromosome segregation ATPase